MAENKEPSQRQLRVAQEIRKIIVNYIDRGEVRNLEGIDTSNGDYLQEVLGGLQLAANFFRKQVASKTSLRYVPEINFRVDKTFEAVDDIERLLRDPKVAQDLK